MPPLQPFVSNVPLQVAKNLRFNDDNGIPVTQMLPIGMNGNVVNDTPKTGYISRIGSVLSDQIDLYNQVTQTLTTYGQNITTLQQQVQALQISGTTIPVINGQCFTGNANSPITTVVELMAESACDYNAVLGTSSALTEAILAEGASTLNVAQAFSQASAMAGLSGWDSNPATIADTINNLWLAYLDSRAGISTALATITPSCSQAIIDFAGNYVVAAGTGSGFSIYFSGYSFIPTAYTDNGSTITIADGAGGIYTTGINLVASSQPGANNLFVGISGTNLSTTAASYEVTLSAKIKSSYNSCTKVVIHNISGAGVSSASGGSYITGTASFANISGTAMVIASNLPWTPGYVDIMPSDSGSASLLHQSAYFTSPTTNGATLTIVGGAGSNFNIRWIAFQQITT
jgi:hypothetical protein